MHELTLLSVFFVVIGFIGLNVLSYYANKKNVFPDVIWVLLAGLLYGYLSQQPSFGLPVIKLNVSLILYLFVPILIFASSQKLCLFHFKDVILPAGLNASIGVLISMVLIALPIHFLFSVPLLLALMFGVIVSATDPLAIAALLSRNKKISESRKLLFEGESIFNDGFVVTIFGVLYAVIYEYKSFDIASSSFHLFTNIVGALVIGAILGRLARWLIKFWQGDYFTLRMNMTIALAFGSFLLSEYFHFSGILGVFAAALAYGYKPNHDDKNIKSQRSVWEYLEYLMNAGLFFLLGASVSSLAMYEGIEFTHVIVAISLVFLSRFFSLLMLWPITYIKQQRLTKEEFWLMNFAGARGAVSIALLLLLPDNSEFKDFFLSIAFIMIIFTLVIYPFLTQKILNKRS